MAVIEIEELSKSFRVKRKAEGLRGSVRSLLRPEYAEKTAVHPITFRVEEGETLAFLGPNGAGKSTTIKMLTGILHPTSGMARVAGFCPWQERHPLAFRIGSVFGQKSQLWYHLPPIDTFELMSRIYEMKRSDFLARRKDLIERFEVEPYLETPVRKLSLGERMRCEIAASLLHRPRIVFLDEPTIGLDVLVKARIRELIRELNREEGTTIFLTSHDPGDIEQLCKRVVVINHGRIMLDDRVSAVKRDFLTHKTIHLKLRKESPDSLPLDGVELVKRKGTGMRLTVDTSRTAIEELLARLIADYGVEDVTIEDPAMEEVISYIYKARKVPGIPVRRDVE